MPKVLTVTPQDGESPEDFAARTAEQVKSFFGSDSGQAAASEVPEQSVDTGTPEAGDGYDSTDVSADSEDQGEQAPSGS